MLLIRRLWLLPAAIVTFLIYFLFFHASDSVVKLKYPANADDGNLHWTKQKQRYPVSTYLSPPRGSARKIPRIQHTFEQIPESYEVKKKREEKRDAVKAAFLHAWNGYKEHAWTKDEVAPLSGGWRTSFGGWGATLVDSMDTLWIMGEKEDFEKCVEAVKAIDFTTSEEDVLNIFEITIRYLGGLLSAYDLSNRRYKVLLTKAKQLADMLYTAFDTPNRMPMTRWTWRISAMGGEVEAGKTTLIAELGSLIIEFTRLTQLTGDLKYFDAVQRINNELDRVQHNSSLPGMWPMSINAQTMEMSSRQFTLSGMADSTYEYLPKQHLLLGGRSQQYGKMFEKAIGVAETHLFFRPMTENGEDVLLSGNVVVDEHGEPILVAEGQHLGCFTGGMVGMAAKIFQRPAYLDVARRLVNGCLWAYNAMPSGLMPEKFNVVPCQTGAFGSGDPHACQWNKEKWYKGIADRHSKDDQPTKMTIDEAAEYWIKERNLVPGFTEIIDPRYILRPEAIESMFIMYRITGDKSLQAAAWKMFQKIDAATRTDIAHASIDNVKETTPKQFDRMESFWLAETLKYFYLIFSEWHVINLDEWILNTEAHPLRRTSGVPNYGGS